jgi:hypothetical protein
VTHVANALRELTHGSGFAVHDALTAVAWSVGILVVAAALSSWKFRKI